MKVTEHIAKAKDKTQFTFEILPPLKGQNIQSIYDSIDPLMEFNPPFIDVTYHREEYVYKELDNGLLQKHVIRKPPDFGINRFGRCTPTLGAFTTEKRYKDLEPVHTGTQATPSSFGRNPIGRTAPASSFGTSTRQDWKAVGFNGVVKAEDSGSSGQFSCLGLKNGGAGFGVSERQLPPFKGLDPGIESPGPAAYIKKPMMGPGSLSTAMSATFGAGKRKTISTDKGLDSPGPVYDPKDFDEIGATADMGEYGRGASFGVGPAHVPPGLNISPFKKYD